MNQKQSLRLRRKRARRLNLFILGLLASALFILIVLLSLLQSKGEQVKNKEINHPTPSTVSGTDKAGQVQEIEWEKQEEPVQLPILMYHAIHVMAPEEASNANLIVAPEVFESHVKALTEANYHFVTPEEAYKILTENVLPKGKKPVWLTFDDSLWDFYDHAYPILKKYQARATNNVITGTVDKAGHLSLNQMKEMQGQGMSFQAHTVHHPDLAVSDPQRQTSELADSKSHLDSNLEQETISLAYPAGRYSADTLAIAKAQGYQLATTTKHGLASLEDGLLSLDRIRIMPNTSAQGLLQEINHP